MPAISGPARLDGTLTAAPGDWTPAGLDFAYAWQRDGVDIAGASGASYTLRAGDVGKRVRVRVTSTNVDGSASAFSAATERVAAPPANTVAPAAPSGTARELSTLTARPGTWDAPDATFSYRWQRCPATATAIDADCVDAGTGSTYTLVDGDVGRRIGVLVTAGSSGGSTSVGSALTGTISRAPLANVAPPAVIGNAYAGETLHGDAGTWTRPGTLAYDWQRCGAGACTSVGDGTSHYALGDDDVDHTIVLVVTATSPGQTVSATSTPLAIRARPVPASVVAPVVTGAAERGSTLRALPGTWTNDPTGITLQWQRCDGAGCQDIAGATGEGYRLGKADEGFAITVAVTATNAVGSGTGTAAATAPVAAAPPVNTCVPVIQSPAAPIQQGMTLTVSGFAWDGTDDTAYGLSWERCAAGVCRTIAGATGAQHTLLAADVGHTIVAISTATNVDGSVSARSAETAVATVMAGPRWRTLPTIAGGGRVGDSVTATPGSWSGPVVATDTTEIMRCTNVCVARAGTSYTVSQGDLGAILRVRETAANAGGETTVWSARYVGPILSTQSAAGVLSARETPLRNAKGETLALAKLSGASGARASAAKPKPVKIALRRPAKVKGKLVAWACPATLGAGATPPPCSARVTVRRSATLSLPASTAGKVRVVVIRGR